MGEFDLLLEVVVGKVFSGKLSNDMLLIKFGLVGERNFNLFESDFNSRAILTVDDVKVSTNLIRAKDERNALFLNWSFLPKNDVNLLKHGKNIDIIVELELFGEILSGRFDNAFSISEKGEMMESMVTEDSRISEKDENDGKNKILLPTLIEIPPEPEIKINDDYEWDNMLAKPQVIITNASEKEDSVGGQSGSSSQSSPLPSVKKINLKKMKLLKEGEYGVETTRKKKKGRKRFVIKNKRSGEETKFGHKVSRYENKAEEREKNWKFLVYYPMKKKGEKRKKECPQGCGLIHKTSMIVDRGENVYITRCSYYYEELQKKKGMENEKTKNEQIGRQQGEMFIHNNIFNTQQQVRRQPQQVRNQQPQQQPQVASNSPKKITGFEQYDELLLIHNQVDNHYQQQPEMITNQPDICDSIFQSADFYGQVIEFEGWNDNVERVNKRPRDDGFGGDQDEFFQLMQHSPKRRKESKERLMEI